MRLKTLGVINFMVILLVLFVSWQPDICQAKKKVKHTAPKTTQAADAPVEPPAKVWGLGLIIGDPLGITLKYWQDRKVAYDFALGSQLAGPGLSAHADYLYHLYVFEDAPELPLYLGGGIFVGAADQGVHAGGRGVVGLTYLFKEPFDVFMELAPSLAVSPAVDFFFTFSIGARIYL